MSMNTRAHTVAITKYPQSLLLSLKTMTIKRSKKQGHLVLKFTKVNICDPIIEK